MKEQDIIDELNTYVTKINDLLEALVMHECRPVVSVVHRQNMFGTVTSIGTIPCITVEVWKLLQESANGAICPDEVCPSDEQTAEM